MLAFTFPGQGSQQPGMGRPWVGHPSWGLVARVSEASGRDVAALLLDADADELRRTDNAQLATYALSLVLHDAVRRLGVRAELAAGHSLGEYSALTATGALPLEAGATLVAERGAAMLEAAAARPGTMAAVLGADDEVVARACAEADGDVWVANHNSAGQVVIAGDAAAIEAAGNIAKAAGARKVMSLPVGGAFHTPFMAPAAARLRAALRVAPWSAPAMGVVANVDASVHTGSAEWAGLLDRQLTSPVRWRQTLATLLDEGVTTFVELGPGSVLTGIAKRTVGDAKTLAAAAPDDLDAVVEVARAGGDVGGATQEAGEHLFAAERLVVSPAAGLFEPSDVRAGSTIDAGTVFGSVAGQEIRSPFRGAVMGLLAVAGERLTRSQPVAWLRCA